MISLDQWAEIRRLHRSEGLGIKTIARRLDVARNTVRAALAADTPPKYHRAPTGSIVDPYVPAIEALLAEFPTMPATVIAERIGWTHAASVLRAKVAELRPRYAPADPADRVTWPAGKAVQCDLWFPPAVVPDESGRLVGPPVLTMIAAYSRFLMALLLPSRAGGDLRSGMWALLQSLGAVPRMLVWDNESGIGAHRRLTAESVSFAGTLGTRLWQARPRDPETKGIVERANGYQRSSFLPGRTFTGPEDFNAQLADWLARANRRRVRVNRGARPVDLLDADRAGMAALPPVAPTAGITTTTRLGRDYYVRIAGCDYSVDPTVIGRIVRVTAGLETVTVTCAGTLVAAHRRCWATGATVTDPAHVARAAGMRDAFQHRPPRPAGTPGDRVPARDLAVYDRLFGLPGPDRSAVVGDGAGQGVA